jgi:transcriptional regulator with XRE-family HTH domain
MKYELANESKHCKVGCLVKVMDGIHMGELLEKAMKKKGMSVSAVAIALDINRRTLYNWFKQKTIDKVIMQKISSLMVLDRHLIEILPNNTILDKSNLQESCWQDKYIDLLEKYAGLLTILKKGKSN